MTVYVRMEKGPYIHGGRCGHAWHKDQWRRACTTDGGGAVYAQKDKSSLAGVPSPQKRVSDGVDDDDGGCIFAVFRHGE